MKVCKKCNTSKDDGEFYRVKDKLISRCKLCTNIENNKYRHKNKTLVKEKCREWYIKNIEKAKRKSKQYKDINRLRLNENNKIYRKNRLRVDLNFKIKSYLRNRVYCAINRSQKTGSAVRDLGCSIDFLKTYLESLWQPNMTWDNWSKDGWHIDHITPLAYFDLTNPEEFKRACHYTNLQPLWAKDNLQKSDNYVRKNKKTDTT